MQNFIFFHAHLDVLSVKFRVKRLQGLVFGLSFPLPSLDFAILDVLDARERLLELGFLGKDLFANQLLNSASFRGEAEARKEQKVEIGRTEVIAAIQIQFAWRLEVLSALRLLDRVFLFTVAGLTIFALDTRSESVDIVRVKHDCHLNVKFFRNHAQVQLTDIGVLQDGAVRLRVGGHQLHLFRVVLSAQNHLPSKL